jgi:hypothetical protein
VNLAPGQWIADAGSLKYQMTGTVELAGFSTAMKFNLAQATLTWEKDEMRPESEKVLCLYFPAGVTKQSGTLKSTRNYIPSFVDASEAVNDYHGKVVTLKFTAYFGGKARWEIHQF